MEINSAGALKVTHGGVEVVRFTDGVHLSELHHVDSNRMDPGALVGFFSIGNPPSESKPIVVTELDSLVIPTAESMRVTRDGLALTADSVARNVNTKTSESFVVSGKNVWRYRFFQPEGEKTVIFGAECKAHGGVNPDAFSAEWGSMGPRQFYALETAGTRTLLHPEPDLRNTLDVTALNPEKKPLFAAGFVIWGLDESGQPRTERTSLSKLGGAERVAVKGDLLSIIRADGKEDFFRITELRRKPGFAENVVDIHAIDSKGVRGDLLAPQVTSLGSFSRPHARHTNIDG
jgi:hypothetical protein